MDFEYLKFLLCLTDEMDASGRTCKHGDLLVIQDKSTHMPDYRFRH